MRRGGRDTDTHRGETTEDAGERWLSTPQGERPRKKPAPPTPRSCTSSLQNRQYISVVYAAQSVVFLWRPEQTNSGTVLQSSSSKKPTALFSLRETHWTKPR